MKKYLALLLALAMVFAFAACGSKEAPAEEPAGEPVEEPVEEPVSGEEATADWNDLAEAFPITYYGVTEAGETVAFVMTEDESFAALAVANTETMQSVSFVGAMERIEAEDGTIGYTITDETNGLALTFVAEFYEDGSVALDLGDYGAMAIMPCENSDAYDLLNAIDAATIAVA